MKRTCWAGRSPGGGRTPGCSRLSSCQERSGTEKPGERKLEHARSRWVMGKPESVKPTGGKGSPDYAGGGSSPSVAVDM